MGVPRYPIGERLRRARERRGLSLAQVAQRTGLSKGFLSRVERDDVSPSLDSLVAIADAVGLAMAEVFASLPVTVQRAEERAGEGLPGQGVHDTLLSPVHDRRVTVLESVAFPGGGGGTELYRVPAEVEVCYVVDGLIELVVEDERYELRSGDVATLAADAPHTWRNLDPERVARVLWVITPALPAPWMPQHRARLLEPGLTHNDLQLDSAG